MFTRYAAARALMRLAFSLKQSCTHYQAATVSTVNPNAKQSSTHCCKRFGKYK